MLRCVEEQGSWHLYIIVLASAATGLQRSLESHLLDDTLCQFPLCLKTFPTITPCCLLFCALRITASALALPPELLMRPAALQEPRAPSDGLSEIHSPFPLIHSSLLSRDPDT